jgi:hypothetical protein
MVYELHLPLHVGTRVHEAGHVILGHEVNDFIPLVGRFHRGILFVLNDEVLAVVGDEAISQRPRRGPETLFSGVEDHARVRLISEGCRGDE